MLWVHFLWQAPYFRDNLTKKIVFHILHFLCSFFVVRAVFGEILTYARGNHRRFARVKSLSPDPSRSPLGTLCVSNRSRLIPCATLSALCACQIGLTWSLAQPSRHFVRVKSVSLWRGADFEIARATRALWACHIALVCGTVLILSKRSCAEILTWRSFAKRLRRDLDKRWQEIFHRDLAKRSLLERLNRDLIYRSLTKILRGDFK